MRPLLLLPLIFSCGVSIPEKYLIEDLRILDVRAEPPEISVFEEAPVRTSTDALLTLRPALNSVVLSALVAHPDVDATFDYEWIRCKDGEGTTGFRRVPCQGARRVSLGTAQSVMVSPVSLVFQDFIEEEETDVAAAISSLASDPRDLLTGLYAYFNLEAKVRQGLVGVDTLSLQATKRLVVFDPTLTATVLRSAQQVRPGQLPTIRGLPLPSLCTNQTDAQLDRLMAYLETREPNRSPSLFRLGYEIEGTISSTASYFWHDAPIELRPGQGVELFPLPEEGDQESYQLIDDNCRLVERKEVLTWSWFTTKGSLSSQLTSLSNELRVGEVVYRAPQMSALTEDETRVRVFCVMRDGRGGSDGMAVEIVVRK